MDFLWTLLEGIASGIGNILLAIVIFALVWWAGSHVLAGIITAGRALWARFRA